MDAWQEHVLKYCDAQQARDEASKRGEYACFGLHIQQVPQSRR